MVLIPSGAARRPVSEEEEEEEGERCCFGRRMPGNMRCGGTSVGRGGGRGAAATTVDKSILQCDVASDIRTSSLARWWFSGPYPALTYFSHTHFYDEAPGSYSVAPSWYYGNSDVSM